MSLEGRPVTVLQVEEAIAGAALNPGDVVQLPDGRAAVVQGTQAVANGAKYSAITRGDIEMACATGTTFSAGADAQWDNATSLVVAAGGDGDFRVGLVKVPKTAGQLVVRIALNEDALEMPA
jgi:hypothetical protein